jgi:hypothetical protein
MGSMPARSRAMPVIAAVCTALAIALAGCAGERGDANSPRHATAAVASGQPGQQRLNEVADHIRQLGQGRFPNAYSGVEVRVGEGVVVVYRRVAADFDRAVRAELPAAPVRFQDAPHTERELTGWADGVRRDLPHWQARDTPVHSVIVRHDGSCVELGTLTIDAVKAHAAVRYPGMPTCVVLAAGPGWGATSPVVRR